VNESGMGMGMKSLKWEGIGTKNLLPHTSSTDLNEEKQMLKMSSSGKLLRLSGLLAKIHKLIHYRNRLQYSEINVNMTLPSSFYFAQ